MAMSFTRPLGPGIYTNSFRTSLPGLLIGFMFLVVAHASKSAADSEQRRTERTLSARTVIPEELREKILLDADQQDGSPVQTNLRAVTEIGLRKLNDPEAVALERVTIEIDLPTIDGADQFGNKLPLELLELLSRRSSALQLELTLRVAPGQEPIALMCFDAVRRNAEHDQIVDVSLIAISLDRSMPANKLGLDIQRTKKLALAQESQR